MKKTAALLASLISSVPLSGQVAPEVGPQIPRQISYQGSVSVDGQPFTGSGRFKFMLVAKNPFTPTPIQATATVSSVVNGAITAVSVNEQGRGYIVAPEVTLSGGGGGSGATFRLNMSSTTGTVRFVNSITVLEGGSGYTAAPVFTIAPPTPAEEAFWTNQVAFNVPLSEPTSSVTIPVSGGLYSTLLGGTGMPELPFDIFHRADLYLRVWFSTNGTQFQRLSPDVPIATVPFSFISGKIVGAGCVASGAYSSAFGQSNEARGGQSFASGRYSIASGLQSAAFGYESLASGSNAFAAGYRSQANGWGSIALGRGAAAGALAEIAIGSYNTIGPFTGGAFNHPDRLVVVGNGISESSRSDALIIEKSGQAFFTADPRFTNETFLIDHAAAVTNTDASTGGDVLALKVSTNIPGPGSNFLSFFDGKNSLLGEVEGNSFGGVIYKSNGADFAEYLPALDPSERFTPGDVVAVRSGKITRDTSSFDQLMVISTNPVVLGNSPAEAEGHHKVAFIGQVPVKAIGAVTSGDFLLASGKNDGSAIAKSAADLRASDRSLIVGRAWDGSDEAGGKLVNAAVGLDLGEALVAELRALGSRVDSLESRLHDLESKDRKVIPVTTR